MKNESVDAALSVDVIMCTRDTYRSFAEIRELAKPGGRFNAPRPWDEDKTLVG